MYADNEFLAVEYDMLLFSFHQVRTHTCTRTLIYWCMYILIASYRCLAFLWRRAVLTCWSALSCNRCAPSHIPYSFVTLSLWFLEINTPLWLVKINTSFNTTEGSASPAAAHRERRYDFGCPELIPHSGIIQRARERVCVCVCVRAFSCAYV